MLCQKTPLKDTNDDEILVTGYFVPCQACNSHFSNSASQEHIDLNHYATYTQPNYANAEIECLLCGKLSLTLIDHVSHVKEKHPYAVKTKKLSRFDQLVAADNAKELKLMEEWKLNKQKKEGAVKLQDSGDFQLLRQVQTNHYEASVRGINYDVIKYAKEYRRDSYDPAQMEAELIWFNIFKHNRICRCYYLDSETGQRSVFCKGYIFFEQQ